MVNEASDVITGPAAHSNRWNISLWVVQGLLLVLYGAVGIMKTTQPIPDLAAMIVWPGMVPEIMVRSIGLAELAGALGMVLPMLTKIQPRLTLWAAIGLMALQVCAMIWHVVLGEFAALPINAVLFGLAAFVYWGRKTKLPLA